MKISLPTDLSVRFLSIILCMIRPDYIIKKEDLLSLIFPNLNRNRRIRYNKSRKQQEWNRWFSRENILNLNNEVNCDRRIVRRLCVKKPRSTCSPKSLKANTIETCVGCWPRWHSTYWNKVSMWEWESIVNWREPNSTKW